MILYTTEHCPRCMMLKTKLKMKNIEYQEVSDEKVLIEKGIMFAPALEVNGKLLDLDKANNYINSL